MKRGRFQQIVLLIRRLNAMPTPTVSSCPWSQVLTHIPTDALLHTDVMPTNTYAKPSNVTIFSSAENYYKIKKIFTENCLTFMFA